MQFKVKDLKKQIEKMNDNDIVCVERVEDIYFEKHGWTSEIHNCSPFESIEFIEAFGTAKIKGKLIIVAHY